MSVKQYDFAVSLLPYAEGASKQTLRAMSKPELSAWITATVARRDEMRRDRHEQAVAEIKQINLLDYISQDLNFRKVGVSHQALCPFHEERTPSFTVTESTNLYHCFGCQKGGDIFTYVMERDGVGFIDALKILADVAGIDLGHNVDMAQIERKPKPKASTKPEIVRPTPSELWRAIDASIDALERHQEAQAYLRSRGLTMETARANQVGYMSLGGFGAVSFPLFLRGEISSVNRRIYNDYERVMPKTMLKKHANTGLFLTSNYPTASTLVVVEGEINALSIWQLGREHINVIGVSGEGNFKSLRSEIHRQAYEHGYTHVAFWADKEKIALAARHRAIINLLDARVSSFASEHDANDLLLAGTLESVLDQYAPPTELLSEEREKEEQLDTWGRMLGYSYVMDALRPDKVPTQEQPQGTGEFPSDKDPFDAHPIYDQWGDLVT